MSTTRTEMLMVGKLFEECPFDRDSGEFEELFCGGGKGVFHIEYVSPTENSAVIAGIDLIYNDEYAGTELTEVYFGEKAMPIMQLQARIEALGVECGLDEIKVYAFTQWS